MMKFYLNRRTMRIWLKAFMALGVWTALASSFFTQEASGQVLRTWALTTGGDWTVASNWVGNVVPSNGDDVEFNNVNGAITDIPAGTFVRDFIKTGTGTVTINDNIQVRRNLSVGASGGFTSTATVTLNGTGAQNVGGAGTTQFNNLTVNNAGNFVTTVFPANFTVNNITNIVGNITVTGTMAVQRGAVSFCSDNNVTRNHTIGTLSLGSASSTISQVFLTVTVNTAIAINNATNSNCTVTVTGDFVANATYSNPTDGGVSLGLASPNCNGGSATLDVQGNFNAPSRIGIVCNGRLPGYSSGSVGSMTFSVGTLNTAGTGNFIITNTNSRFNGNGPGTTTPSFILRGGTSANPATYNVPYVVFTGSQANASTVMDIDGVYNVVNGSSVTIAAVPARRLRINGTLIVENGGEIAGADVGAGSTNPWLEMDPNGRLVVRDPNGLGNGSSATAFQFCINRRGAPNNWNLTNLASNGTVEYNGAGPSSTQRITDLSTATPATQYNNLEINNLNGSLTSTGGPPFTYNNACIADGVVGANSLIIRRGVCVLTPTTGSGTLTHPIGSITIGSATSSTVFVSPSTNSNTALVVNNRANTTVNLNVTGNVTGDPSATNGVLLIMGGQDCNAACVTNFNISGNFNFGIPLFFAGNTSTTTSGNHTLNLGGNFIISSPNSRFNAYRFTATPGNFQVNFTGTSATYTVPSNVLLGTAGNLSNVLCNWQVSAGASLTMTSGSVLACNNGRSLSVLGELTCQDNTELIATSTGAVTGSSTLTMGPNGRIRLADPQGLGDGTLLNPLSNFPLFILRPAADFGPPASNWDLTSISSNGTIEYNGTVTQAVTARPYNNLVINNTGGAAVSNSPPPPFFLFNNPNIVEGNITANSVELWRGVFILTPVGSGGSFAHTFGTLSIGSATSSTTFPTSSNTVLVLNNRPSSTVTLTVTGNVSGATSATGGSGLVMGGIDCNNLCNTTLTVNGNFTFSVPLYLAGNLSVNLPGGSGTNILEFGGNVSLANTCRFSGDRFGVGADPTIRLTGASATFTVPSVVWLGTGNETNILAKWEIPTGASITLPNGSSIACSNNRNFTLNGTLIAQDGAEMIATLTGPSPIATSNLIMGSNGIIRVADPDGLGNGDQLNPTSNFPLFIRRTSPSSSNPQNWNLTSLNTAGTVDYNGTALQTITARNSSAPYPQYHRLTISGGNKTLESTNGSVFVNDQLTLQGGIVSSVNASDVVRMLNTATGAITRSAGHINARLERTLTGTGTEDYFYPIGDADDYRPLTLNDVTASGAIIGFREIRQSPRAAGGTFPPPPGEVSNVRYWLGSRVSGAWTSAGSISLDYGPNDGVDAGGTSVVMAHRSNTINGVYLNYGQSGSVPAGSGTLTSSLFPTGAFGTVGQLEYFTLGTTNPTDNPLPVELVGFKGEATVLGVVLEWQTASERDNAGFVLVRNGEVIADYREHAALRGMGTSAIGRRYRFIDERVREGERYVYALRSVDFDGTVHDYGVRVEVEGKRVSREYELMQNYPNPFNPVTTIRYVLPEESEVWVRVYDMLGRMVKEVVGGVRQGAGVYEVRFEGSGLGSGVYVYRMEAVGSRGRYVASKKMVLMK